LPPVLENRPELARRLDEDLVGWLTTVTPSGQPQSSVVWFLRVADDLLVYSQPGVTKLANIAANPKVSFNLRGDPQGDMVATFEGTASILDEATPAHEDPAYLDKYGSEITRIGWTPEEFASDYSALIRIHLTRARGQ
jgi:PPOX class probable F420-dependent enzyme